jgi:hypothetical protein
VRNGDGGGLEPAVDQSGFCSDDEVIAFCHG